MRKLELEKYLKNQPKVEFAEDTPPICRSRRDIQCNLQQKGKILTHDSGA